MTRPAALVLFFLLASACGERERPPPAPLVDAGPRPDGGSFDARVVRRDAGPSEPIVDGVVEAGEWRGAVVAEASVGTDRPGSTLTRMRAVIEGERLYVALEATLAPGDALIAYVDAELGEPEGARFAALSDTDQPLDAALSRDLDVSPAFAPELAFGTTVMPHAVVGLDSAAGWRDVAADPTTFTWLDGLEAPMVCSVTACEAAISLARLGGSRPRTVALFARIVDADGALTNQTLPADSASQPARVRAFLELEDGMVLPDAGAPLDAGAAGDGGADAGAGVVVDGVIGAAEWAGATVAENSVPATGGFVDDALGALYLLRTPERLYMGVTGALSPGNAIVVYVDHDYFGGDGLASPTPLDDTSGELDLALSKTMFTPSEMRIDFAWGTLELDRASAGDARMGWRDVGSDPSAFRAVSAPSACSRDACETSIALRDLGVIGADEVAVFARLVSASSDAFSNQTLPEDDPGAAELVSVVAVVGP